MDRKRHKTSHPGIYYRERADGTRQYVIWFKGTDGKTRFENVPGGERDAVKARARVVDRIAHGHKVQPTRERMDAYSRRWLETYSPPSPRTRELYAGEIERHIIRLLGHHRVTEMDVHKIAGYIATRKKEGYKAWTIRSSLTPLRHILKRAVRDGLLPTNPMDLLERHERPKSDQRRMEILDSQEINSYLGAATELYRPLLATILFTGMRIGEVLALTWDDIDWQNGIIHVHQSKTDAGVREVVLMPSLKKLLAEYKLARGSEGRVFWITDRRAVLRAHWRTVKRAGIRKHIRIHDLRHTLASILIDQGMSAPFICEQMGHANVATTMRIYGHLFDREKRRDDARERLEQQFGGML